MQKYRTTLTRASIGFGLLLSCIAHSLLLNKESFIYSAILFRDLTLLCKRYITRVMICRMSSNHHMCSLAIVILALRGSSLMCHTRHRHHWDRILEPSTQALVCFSESDFLTDAIPKAVLKWLLSIFRGVEFVAFWNKPMLREKFFWSRPMSRIVMLGVVVSQIIVPFVGKRKPLSPIKYKSGWPSRSAATVEYTRKLSFMTAWVYVSLFKAVASRRFNVRHQRNWHPGSQNVQLGLWLKLMGFERVDGM